MATAAFPGRCALCGDEFLVDTPIARTWRGWAHSNEVQDVVDVLTLKLGLPADRVWCLLLPRLKPGGQEKEPPTPEDVRPRCRVEVIAKMASCRCPDCGRPIECDERQCWRCELCDAAGATREFSSASAQERNSTHKEVINA